MCQNHTSLKRFYSDVKKHQFWLCKHHCSIKPFSIISTNFFYQSWRWKGKSCVILFFIFPCINLFNFFSFVSQTCLLRISTYQYISIFQKHNTQNIQPQTDISNLYLFFFSIYDLKKSLQKVEIIWSPFSDLIFW